MPQDLKLPQLNKEAFDGEHEEAHIHRDVPIAKSCQHTGVRLISSTEIKCPCGVGWTGHNILTLYNALKSQ